MIFILLKTIVEKSKKVNWNRRISLSFALLLILIIGQIIIQWPNDNADVFQARNNSDYRIINDLQFKEITDENTDNPIQEYTWNLGNLEVKDNCLSFYTEYQYIYIYIDNELVYSVSPKENFIISSTVGRRWVLLQLDTSDSYKDITIKLVPQYKNVKLKNIEFTVGTMLTIIEDTLRNDLLCIILGTLTVIIGIVFCAISVFHLTMENKISNLLYIGILSLITGFWRLFDTRLFTLIFSRNQTVVTLIVFYTDMLLAIPCIMYVQSCFKRRYLILDILCIINIVNGIFMAIIQPFTFENIRGHFIYNNIILMVSAVTSLFMCFKELKKVKITLKSVIMLVCIILCCISSITDIIAYYITGTSFDLTVTITSFLIYFIILGIISMYDLNHRAVIDRHTGLSNKSVCMRMIEDEEILYDTTAFFMFDLNNLKVVNDTHGHEIGDKLIYDFAKIITRNIPHNAFAGRFGGDEFMVIFRNTNKEEILEFTNAMKSSVDKYNNLDNSYIMSFSYGCAISTEFEKCTIHMLMKRADYNMYVNKNKFHNIYGRDKSRTQAY